MELILKRDLLKYTLAIILTNVFIQGDFNKSWLQHILLFLFAITLFDLVVLKKIKDYDAITQIGIRFVVVSVVYELFLYENKNKDLKSVLGVIFLLTYFVRYLRSHVHLKNIEGITILYTAFFLLFVVKRDHYSTLYIEESVIYIVTLFILGSFIDKYVFPDPLESTSF